MHTIKPDLTSRPHALKQVVAFPVRATQLHNNKSYASHNRSPASHNRSACGITTPSSNEPTLPASITVQGQPQGAEWPSHSRLPHGAQRQTDQHAKATTSLCAEGHAHLEKASQFPSVVKASNISGGCQRSPHHPHSASEASKLTHNATGPPKAKQEETTRERNQT